MTDIINSIDREIEHTLVMDDYDGGYVAGLRQAKMLLESASEDGPRYFGNKNNCDTPLN
jgi:hypothetical protein